MQKQSSRGVLGKRCSENMQQIYRRTPMPKRDFNKVACNFVEITLLHGCSPVNLLHIFRIRFSKDTSGQLLLAMTQRLLIGNYKFQEFWQLAIPCQKDRLSDPLDNPKLKFNNFCTTIVFWNVMGFPFAENQIHFGRPWFV